MYSAQPVVSARPRVLTGFLLSLLVLPAGVIVYAFMYQVGFIVSIAAFGIAWLAAKLYLKGAGGALDRTGMLVIIGVTALTIVASVAGGIAWQFVHVYAKAFQISESAVLSDPNFWPFVEVERDDPDYMGAVLSRGLLSLAFGAYGCFSILRRMWRQTAARAAGGYAPPPAVQAPWYPPAQPPQAQVSGPPTQYGTQPQQSTPPTPGPPPPVYGAGAYPGWYAPGQQQPSAPASWQQPVGADPSAAPTGQEPWGQHWTAPDAAGTGTTDAAAAASATAPAATPAPDAPAAPLERGPYGMTWDEERAAHAAPASEQPER